MASRLLPTLAIIATIALALPVIVRSAGTAKTPPPVARAAVGTHTAGTNVLLLPVSYRRMPAAKLAALGIIRNPKTGLWMCVATKNGAQGAQTAGVHSNPWPGLLR